MTAESDETPPNGWRSRRSSVVCGKCVAPLLNGVPVGLIDDAAKTAGKVRDGAHAALGGKNASGLEHKGHHRQGNREGRGEGPARIRRPALRLALRQPQSGCNDPRELPVVRRHRLDCRDRAGSRRHRYRGWVRSVYRYGGGEGQERFEVPRHAEFTVYAVCVRDDS